MITEQALGYCLDHGMTAQLAWAIRRARGRFPDATITAIHEPENADFFEHILIRIRDPRHPTEGSKDYFGLVQDWTTFDEWETAKCIRFDYNHVTA